MSCRGTYFALALAASLACSATVQAAEIWEVESGGTITLSLEDALLESVGLTLLNPSKTVVPARSLNHVLDPPFYSFGTASNLDLSFETRGGRFVDFVGTERASVPVNGGLTFQTHHTASRVALAPVFLYDFSVEFAAADEAPVFARIVTNDPSAPVPFEIWSTGVYFDHTSGRFAVPMGDIRISQEWADSMGQSYLAGQVVGVANIEMSANLIEGKVRQVMMDEPKGPGQGGVFLDVKLGQLYGLSNYGHAGTFPNGDNGFSCATTSCNVGNVRVPWHSPMDPEHPMITMGMYRLNNGIFEQIGLSDIKHGFFALSSSQCDQCTDPTGGDSLGVNCSDTYSAGNNASQHYLGPRDEINAYTGGWDPCGSHFDGPNGDCNRSHSGGSHSSDVEHRIHVYDSDLNVAGATFYYEGLYVVANEDNWANNWGWRQLNSVNWNGSSWSFSNPSGLIPNPGPALKSWGDSQVQVAVASDDGDAMLATKVIDLGGGQWHYEYALLNMNSARGVRSFTVPVGSANLSNISFHDADQDDPGNDWTVSVAGGLITWSTDTFIVDPNAHALDFQEMFNFRFDADAGPDAATASGGIFRPGVGTSFDLATEAPAADPTGVIAGTSLGEDFVLSRNEPNPFSDNTKLSFSLARETDVSLSVVDVSGRTVRVLHDGIAAAGATSVQWDGRDVSGNQVASGVYFFRLESGARSTTIKATFLR